MGESVQSNGKWAWEIRVLWNDTLMDVLELRDEVSGEASDQRRFVIGEESSCDFPVDESWLGGASRFGFVDVDDLGRLCLRIPSEANGWLIRRRGERRHFKGMVLAGEGQRCGEHVGAHLFELEDVCEAQVELGPFTFQVRRTVTEERLAGGIQVDRRSFIFPSASLFVHGLFFLLIYLIPPKSKAFQFDPLDGTNRYVNMMILQPPNVVQTASVTPKGKSDSAKQASKSDSGTAQTKSVNKSAANSRPNRRPSRDEVQAARNTRFQGHTRETIGLLGPAGTIQHAGEGFQPSAGGFVEDPENALAAYLNGGASSLCMGGLCAIGPGRRPGVLGDTIKSSPLWHSDGRWRRTPGWDKGVPLGPRGPKHNPPGTIVPGIPEPKGAISKDQVRRVVRRHLPEIRHCYNGGLINRPDLAGRVVVRFVVSGKGVVLTSAVGSSSLGDPKVERCIAQAVRRWAFPSPSDGGVVMINYPFVLNAP